MIKVFFFCLSATVLAFSSTSGDDCLLTVQRLLNNKEPLDKPEWTRVNVSCVEGENPVATITPFREGASFEIYFANENKNILVVNFLGPKIYGYKYETPHGRVEKVIGPNIAIKNGEISSKIPSEWFPKNVTRMSASVEVNNVIHNYYGIFNYEMSIPDTLIVEEYKKLKCCLKNL